MIHAFEISVASVTRFRPVVCVTAILLHAVCSAPAALAYCAYVTNQHSASVSVIDTATAAVVDVVNVGPYPSGVAATPDGRFVYVVCDDEDPGAELVWRIDTSSNDSKATGIKLGDLGGGPPWFVAITLDGRRAYVTVPDSSFLPVIDTASGTVAQGPGLQRALSVAVTPDGRFAYVTQPSTSGIEVVSRISTESNTIVDTIQAGNGPFGVAITPDGSFAYVANIQGLDALARGDVSKIDTKNDAVVDTIPVGNNPAWVAITPDGRWVYVTNSQGPRTSPVAGDVSVIDTTNDKVIDTIQVANLPIGVAITPDGRFAYVANNRGVSGSSDRVVPGNVSVIDTGTHAVVATIPIGNNPVGIAISTLPMCVDGHPTCVGDCGIDRQVTVDEILMMVNVALGNAQLSACRAGDANGDGQITIDEILTAVNSALNGCVQTP
jgi:YVTN family beta-propeller protein